MFGYVVFWKQLLAVSAPKIEVVAILKLVGVNPYFWTFGAANVHPTFLRRIGILTSLMLISARSLAVIPVLLIPVRRHRCGAAVVATEELFSSFVRFGSSDSTSSAQPAASPGTLSSLVPVPGRFGRRGVRESLFGQTTGRRSRLGSRRAAAAGDAMAWAASRM